MKAIISSLIIILGYVTCSTPKNDDTQAQYAEYVETFADMKSHYSEDHFKKNHAEILKHNADMN